MPFHVEHDLFILAERASRRAENTTKKNREARKKNNLAAAEAHKKAADAYRLQTGTDQAGERFLPEKTTKEVAEGYVALHELRVSQHLVAAKNS